MVPVQDSMRRRARDRASAAPAAVGPSLSRPQRPLPSGNGLERALELIADDRRIELVTALFLVGIVEKCVEANRKQTLTQGTLLDLLRTIKRLIGEAEQGLQLSSLRKALEAEMEVLPPSRARRHRRA